MHLSKGKHGTVLRLWVMALVPYHAIRRYKGSSVESMCVLKSQATCSLLQVTFALGPIILSLEKFSVQI